MVFVGALTVDALLPIIDTVLAEIVAVAAEPA
jgi:hypothetical protein